MGTGRHAERDLLIDPKRPRHGVIPPSRKFASAAPSALSASTRVASTGCFLQQAAKNASSASPPIRLAEHNLRKAAPALAIEIERHIAQLGVGGRPPARRQNRPATIRPASSSPVSRSTSIRIHPANPTAAL